MAEQDFLEQEMEAGSETTDLSAPSADEAAAEAKDTRTWTLPDGSEVSKSEFIRYQFTQNNLSRKQISEQFDINYRTVYGATLNMTNDAEPSTRGRTAAQTKIKVTPDNRVVTVIEDVYHIDNAAVSDDEGQAAMAEATEVDRNTWIKQQVESGKPRGDIAAALGLSYGVVYSMTKEIEGSKQRHELVDEETGETVTRSELIRRLHSRGMEKSAIAKHLGVEYPVVWSALKGLKTEEEKFADAVDRVAKFAESAVDADAFNALIEQLRAVQLAQPADEESSDNEEAAE